MSDDVAEGGGAARQETIAAKLQSAWTRQLDRFASFGAAAYPALLVGAAVFAYFLQPVLRFMPYYRAYEGAGILAMGLILSRVAFKFERDALGLFLGLFAVGTGLYFLNDGIEAAMASGLRNDQRCAIIEQDMLSEKPSRPDLPDLFNALGCRAQGQSDFWLDRYPKQR